eukprot:scaffold91781_cov15-Tisochrysis_lutea.AAC.1
MHTSHPCGKGSDCECVWERGERGRGGSPQASDRPLNGHNGNGGGKPTDAITGLACFFVFDSDTAMYTAEEMRTDLSRNLHFFSYHVMTPQLKLGTLDPQGRLSYSLKCNLFELPSVQAAPFLTVFLLYEAHLLKLPSEQGALPRMRGVWAAKAAASKVNTRRMRSDGAISGVDRELQMDCNKWHGQGG